MSDDIPAIGRVYQHLAALPLVLRRRLVRGLFTAFDRVERVTGRGRDLGHADLYQRVLRVSQREAGQLAFETRLHDVAAEVEWLAMHRRPWRAVRRDMTRIRCEGEATLERVAATGRPVILTPLHMGAYVIGLGHTMLRFFPGRRLLILRQRDDQGLETRVMERMREVGVDLRFLQVARRADFLSAIRFAREGAVIVLFCDLPPSYGSPAEMPIFGLDTSFAFGVDAFARLTNATVVPWSSVMASEGDTIRIGRPFETQGDTPDDRAHVALLMREHIRDALCNFPEQWHLWCTLSDYLPDAGKVADGPSPAEGGSLRDAAMTVAAA